MPIVREEPYRTAARRRRRKIIIAILATLAGAVIIGLVIFAR